MYERPGWVYCFNLKGQQLQSQSCGVESGNLTYWFGADKSTFPLTFSLHYLSWYFINWGKYSAGVRRKEGAAGFFSFLFSALSLFFFFLVVVFVQQRFSNYGSEPTLGSFLVFPPHVITRVQSNVPATQTRPKPPTRGRTCFHFGSQTEAPLYAISLVTMPCANPC